MMTRFSKVLVLVGLAATLVSSGLGGEPPAVSGSDYEQVRELARLGWLDLAARSAARLSEGPEATLARGWLAFGRARAERDARKRLALFGEAAKALGEARKAAAGEPRILDEAGKLEREADGERFRAACEVIFDPRTTPEEREAIGAEVEKHQQAAIKSFIEEMARSEAAYAYELAIYRTTGDFMPPSEIEAALQKAAAKKNKAFDAYWRASARCIQEMIRFGEFWPPADARQKKLGRQIADLVSGWVRKQNEKYEPLGPETAGVEMFMSYALGHGWALAGETARAVEALEKAIAVDPELMTDKVQARAIWTRAVYYKARTLADAAEKSGRKADWEKALGAIDVQMFMGLPGTDPILAIKARVLKGKCHGKLGALEAAETEFDRALRAADRVE